MGKGKKKEQKGQSCGRVIPASASLAGMRERMKKEELNIANRKLVQGPGESEEASAGEQPEKPLPVRPPVEGMLTRAMALKDLDWQNADISVDCKTGRAKLTIGLGIPQATGGLGLIDGGNYVLESIIFSAKRIEALAEWIRKIEADGKRALEAIAEKEQFLRYYDENLNKVQVHHVIESGERNNIEDEDIEKLETALTEDLLAKMASYIRVRWDEEANGNLVLYAEAMCLQPEPGSPSAAPKAASE